MARRYSGDAEVRVWWDARRREYHGSVRDPYFRFPGKAAHRGSGDPTAHEAYDRAAAALLEQAEQAARREHPRGRLMLARKAGRIVVLRTFQPPCPKGRH